MDIKVTNINYRIDDEGNTTEIGTTFSGYSGGQSVNANMTLATADLDEGASLDDLTRKQIETLGRKKLADAVSVATTESGDPAN